MIDKADAEELARFNQAFGDFNVLGAGFWIACRMVVRHKYRVCSVSDGFTEHISRMNRRLADRPMRDINRFAERP